MPNKVYRLSSIGDIRQQRVLFDTNIWLLVNGVNQGADKERVDEYSAAFNDLLRNDNEILVNDYVIGEYANRSAKLAFDLYCQANNLENTPKNFKRIRKTSKFRKEMTGIKELCLDMVRDCTYIGASGHLVIDEIINSFASGLLDFTDLVLEKFCTSERALLMTDDGDFADANLTIISRNPYLLRRARRTI